MIIPEDKSSRVFQLMDELARAKLRGVEVKVILDYQSSSGITLGQTSYEAFRFLKDKGIICIRNFGQNEI